MSANNRMPRRPQRRYWPQTGAFAVEFAIVITLFLTLTFCVIEVARMMYLWNTLQEVTRRAAAAAVHTDFTNVSAMNLVRQQAIFLNSQGTLLLGDPVTDAHIRIDYMSLTRASGGAMTLTPISGALPSSPTQNQVTCMGDPYSANCIRFVRVRVCASSSAPGECDPLPYVPLLPLIPSSLVSLLNLPPSTTIAKAETLGYEPGQPL
jgi:Flp pilus assembly protein TadG